MKFYYKGKEETGQFIAKNSDGSYKIRMTDSDGDSLVVTILDENILVSDAPVDRPKVDDGSKDASRPHGISGAGRDSPEAEEVALEDPPEKKKGTDPDKIVRLAVVGVAILVLANY